MSGTVAYICDEPVFYGIPHKCAPKVGVEVQLLREDAGSQGDSPTRPPLTPASTPSDPEVAA